MTVDRTGGFCSAPRRASAPDRTPPPSLVAHLFLTVCPTENHSHSSCELRLLSRTAAKSFAVWSSLDSAPSLSALSLGVLRARAFPKPTREVNVFGLGFFSPPHNGQRSALFSLFIFYFFLTRAQACVGLISSAAYSQV